MTSATTTPAYPFSATATAIAASSRPRCERQTTSRGAAWRPRGSGGAASATSGMGQSVYSPGNNNVSTKSERLATMTATAEPLTDPPAGDARPRHVRVGIVGAGVAGLGMPNFLRQAGGEVFIV